MIRYVSDIQHLLITCKLGCDNIKRRAFCFLIIVMMLFSLSFVSAGFSHHEIRATNGTISFDDHKFNIPEGYVEDMKLEQVDVAYASNKDLSYSQAVFNQTNSSNYFTIFVTYANNGSQLTNLNPGVNYTNTSIKGIDGCLFSVGNETIFTFSDKGNLVEFHSNSGAEIFEKIL